MRRIRVGVTGLSRAGKTVFLTSMINQLLQPSPDNFPAFRDAGVTLSGREVRVPEQSEKFPYLANLESLRRESPAWPGSTTSISRFQVALKLGVGGRCNDVLLELVDYPGERLLDLPLLSRTYDQWADDTFETAALLESRCNLGQSWKSALAGLQANTSPHSPAAVALLEEYRRYVRACYHHGLVNIQPSAMLTTGSSTSTAQVSIDAAETGASSPRGDPPLFFPLPRRLRAQNPGLAREMTSRYERYRRQAKASATTLLACDRQLVLVDILETLRDGVDRQRDTRTVLREILDVFHYESRSSWSLTGWVRRWFGQSGIDRVAFVATKADQATRADRSHLGNLLENLIAPKLLELKAMRNHGSQRVFHCAAYRSTEDDEKIFQGRGLAALRGVLHPDERERWTDGEFPDQPHTVYPGQIPPEWPDDWSRDQEFRQIRRFLPKRLAARDGAAMEHINLDLVLWHILKDFAPL